MKIDGFNGKFQQGGAATATPAAAGAQTPPVRPATQPSGAAQPLRRSVPLRTFGVKEAMNEVMEEAAHLEKPAAYAAESHRVKAKDSFTAEQVSAALRQYVGTLRSDQAVKVALTSHRPRVEGFVITLEVDNDFLLERVNDLQASLADFLSRQLNNGYITLNVKVYVEPTDGKEEKRLFTAKDKLDYFLSKNPAVAELKSLFGLELE